MPKEGTGLHTISFDGDGCLWEPTWPSPVIGEANPRAVKALLEYRRLGYEIIIFTSRPASHLPAIRRWLYENDLNDEVYDIVTGKPRAAMYIDDRAVTFPEAFERLEEAPESDLPSHTNQYDGGSPDPLARMVDENVRMAAEAVGFEAGAKYGRRKALEEEADSLPSRVMPAVGPAMSAALRSVFGDKEAVRMVDENLKTLEDRPVPSYENPLGSRAPRHDGRCFKIVSTASYVSGDHWYGDAAGCPKR